ncbi:hypothetical protein AUEXF2481DRAFT_1912 [Aureobasidium subglaciale EXF-2481]|uniref:ER transporter 6TM N-terminal domain-containing protein n=1 Tax=Aureobasidium subglaciale (strain EXF-2481) TaxID=1043005 RepID=A0A074YSF4_AURSE|nr:uncharacterized protein AUEXF2481DRAFT_1912 [Aureobasidium subglaciale EXF-2481]KAI5205514.1 hypothetical protein E4T38_04291 [Aureobasidium subglaciale]KAI5224597.1 hypothetical protein E4T40_03897 [Aureobasidium subglaciale]KAI5227703.1 hypothetical protein E4T41_04117 [Aureobasidium subglaciale]KAI5263233.1 hypothetical protein E4T46_03738 [Aureobasidium subglaciale]KEQ99094.1 hypothetical protein AUEXF2481DRAFT_1912 [Aureobasidium subglaciale EXF-2481]
MSSEREPSGSATEKESRNGNSSPLQQTNTRATSTAPSNKKKKLPPFLDHFNARDLKILFRCSVAFWVASLLIVIEPTLQTFGNATFFGCIVIMFLPPSGVVLVFLLGGFTMILGMGLAWAWGVIAMKAALATRPQAETQARLQALGQQAARNVGATTYSPVSVLIYNGFMLDNRVTVTYFCMLGLFVYLMARLRIRVPKLALTAIFAWIITDVFLTIGPLLPAFQGTIPQVLIKPAAAAIAISLACSMLIFPESTSHMTLHGMHKLVTSMTGSLDLTRGFLANYPDTSHMEPMQGLRSGVLGGWAALEPAFGFLSFDLSFGHWSAQDIASLREPIRRVMVGSMSLLAFEILQGRSRERMNELRSNDIRTQEATGSEEREKKYTYGRHQVMQSLNLVDALRDPEVGQSVADSYQALSHASDPLLEACKDTFQAIAHSINENNSRRWFGRISADEFAKMRQSHVDVLEHLREEKAKFPDVANEALLTSHQHLFDENGRFHGHTSERHKLVGMFFGFNFEDRLLILAAALERALEQITLIEKERNTVRLWFPTGLRKFGAWAFGGSKAPAIGAPSVADMPQADKATIEEVQQSFRRVHKPTRKRSKISAIILGFGHWLSNDEGIFALRILIATLAAAIPAVCTTSSGFYYREKGLWALIMAQTGTATFSAEFNFAFITRIFGTIAGGVLGMLGWYIGSGNGPGNPYGLGAVLAVYAVILMWFRLYTPPPLIPAVMIGGATVILVIGYSYIDTHLPTYGNPGWGYEVFWRRTVLVLVGFGVSFIVTLLPWPSSLSRNIARRLSGVLDKEADHYAAILSSWSELDIADKHTSAIEAVTIQLAGDLGSLGGPIASLRFELSSSVFDSQTCGKIKSIAEFINYQLAHLHIRAATLSPELRRRFAIASGILDHRAIADVMVVLGIVAQSLKTGDPLPARLPTPLLKKCLEHGHGADVETLTIDVLKKEGVRGYTVCMSAYLGFLSGIDELVLALKEAVGEAHHLPDDLKLA